MTRIRWASLDHSSRSMRPVSRRRAPSASISIGSSTDIGLVSSSCQRWPKRTSNAALSYRAGFGVLELDVVPRVEVLQQRLTVMAPQRRVAGEAALLAASHSSSGDLGEAPGGRTPRRLRRGRCAVEALEEALKDAVDQRSARERVDALDRFGLLELAQADHLLEEEAVGAAPCRSRWVRDRLGNLQGYSALIRRNAQGPDRHQHSVRQ